MYRRIAWEGHDIGTVCVYASIYKGLISFEFKYPNGVFVQMGNEDAKRSLRKLIEERKITFRSEYLVDDSITLKIIGSKLKIINHRHLDDDYEICCIDTNDFINFMEGKTDIVEEKTNFVKFISSSIDCLLRLTYC